MKIILTEKQLELIQKNLINEIDLGGGGDQYIAGGSKTQSFKNAINSAKNQIGKSLVKGTFPKTAIEIADFQRFARKKGFKNVRGKKKGQLITVDGKWGPNSEAAWKKLSSSYYLPKTNTPQIKTGNTSWLKSTSKQVKNQIEYLMNQGFNKPFTVLDDINSKVYAVNSDYSIYGVYNVVTGKDRGDEIKDVSFGKWYRQNPFENTWKFLKDVFSSDVQTAVDNLDSKYFGSELWVKKNTPSGVFLADKSVGNWLESKVMTYFAEKDYGKRFIGFNKLDGSPLAVGFHGTKNPKRIDITKDDWSKAVKNAKGNYSFGCVNFKDSDIQNINNFIKNGQYSFWLPDTTSKIVEIPANEKPNFIQRFLKSLQV